MADAQYEPTPSIPVSELFSLKGQVALVTGGTRGIGEACAIALAEVGASICLAQRNPAHTTVQDKIRTLNVRCEILPCDLGDLEAVKTLFDRALELMGGEIHILFNCGGMQYRAPAVDFPEEKWDEIINVNLKSLFLVSQAAGRHMVPRHRGKIINIASLTTFIGGVSIPAYASSKGAVGQLTKALRNEWSRHNVQVNAIAPGYIATEINADLRADETQFRQLSERIPAGRWGTPADFAGPTVFLASAASQYISGEVMVVDGGFLGR
ncbi:NADP-binding protein [Dacryopinax primogenitus]|uniref:NADP-binding protein n=1 Tax=Dacryopinax primogenitus (strain DJM 731) TaxID=1858805 RepID=M5G0J6_DACPD|nr:NADP-binding protein [Dacryopinax primogenitus]EJT99351.1 NADP-binding protein [Dacryopinax primogenitus]